MVYTQAHAHMSTGFADRGKEGMATFTQLDCQLHHPGLSSSVRTTGQTTGSMARWYIDELSDECPWAWIERLVQRM